MEQARLRWDGTRQNGLLGIEDGACKMLLQGFVVVQEEEYQIDGGAMEETESSCEL